MVLRFFWWRFFACIGDFGIGCTLRPCFDDFIWLKTTSTAVLIIIALNIFHLIENKLLFKYFRTLLGPSTGFENQLYVNLAAVSTLIYKCWKSGCATKSRYVQYISDFVNGFVISLLVLSVRVSECSFSSSFSFPFNVAASIPCCVTVSRLVCLFKLLSIFFLHWQSAIILVKMS